MDMFSREMEEDLWARTYKDSHFTMKPALDPAAAKAIAEKLVNAKNPVIHAGGGIILAKASDELAALAEFLDIPVSRTLMGHGCLSDRHPLLVGQTGFWGLEFTHSITLNADVILGLGTRFAEADSSSWYQGVTFDPQTTTFLQIDIDPMEIGRNYPVEIGAVGDLKIGLQQILDEVKKICPEGKSNPELRTKIAETKAAFKKENEAISNDGRFPMTPQRILKDVKEVLPEDAHIFTDVGWNKNGVAQQFDITVPGTIHHSSGLATMGFGASAVLGGKVAAPDKVCITLTGDGGFGVNPTCLATAVEKGIACTWVVMNNSAFGTIAGLENANYQTKFGTVFTTPDGESYSPSWAGVAEAYGVEAICVKSADEFKPAMEKALAANAAGKPFLVEAPMENIVVPTPGCWNINDIYSPNELVKEGKLVQKENGRYVTPNHAKSHKAK
jgi:acetolactate synthase-1/2/3 large subunit